MKVCVTETVDVERGTCGFGFSYRFKHAHISLHSLIFTRRITSLDKCVSKLLDFLLLTWRFLGKSSCNRWLMLKFLSTLWVRSINTVWGAATSPVSNVSKHLMSWQHGEKTVYGKYVTPQLRHPNKKISLHNWQLQLHFCLKHVSCSKITLRNCRFALQLTRVGCEMLTTYLIQCLCLICTCIRFQWLKSTSQPSCWHCSSSSVLVKRVGHMGFQAFKEN